MKFSVSNKEVLTRAGLTSRHALLTQRRLRWLGHVRRMNDGRMPKDILYGELETGTRPTGRPMLRFKDVCKRDLKAGNGRVDDWEVAASDRVAWRLTVRSCIRTSEQRREEKWDQSKANRKHRLASAPTVDQSFPCTKCSKICRSRIGLHSHTRRCNSTNN